MPYEIKSPLHRRFLANIKARRLELQLTQSDVARRMGVTIASYCQTETGRRTPTISHIEKVAKALKCNPLELLSVRELAGSQ